MTGRASSLACPESSGRDRGSGTGTGHANCGEIAVRVIRACQELGIETVLAASEADANGLAAQIADRVVRIGPARASESYLNPRLLVGAAIAHKADALHP